MLQKNVLVHRADNLQTVPAASTSLKRAMSGDRRFFLVPGMRWAVAGLDLSMENTETTVHLPL